jgi:SMI1-KNR4 cell-wall
MTTIENPGPRLSESDISNLEMRLGVELPRQYRRFLMDFNGGCPTPDTVDVGGLPGSATDVQVFFGIDRSDKSNDVEWNLTTLAERLEQGLLPIASDSCGSVFCLSLRRHDRGAVLYCDLQSVFADFDSAPKFYHVASDFEAFLKGLRSFP